MKYFKVFAMFILSIIILINLYFSVGTFRSIKFLGAYWIPSFILLIGFIFLMIYVAKTKNIYNLIASLFLNISIIIVLSNLYVLAFFDELTVGLSGKDTKAIIYIVIFAVVSSIFLVGFMTLFFYFKSKSKKYIEQLSK